MPPVIREDAVFRSYTQIGDELLRKAWAPTIYNVAFEPHGRWLTNRIPRTSRGVVGMEVNIPFQVETPVAWRGMTAHGYTPSGADRKYAQQKFKLSCAVAACNATFEEIKACGMSNAAIKDSINQKARDLVKSFPYFLKAVLWTTTGSGKAVGVVASVGGTGNCTITLDNAGLDNTITEDRCKLLVRGMVLQGYDGSTNLKKGAPVTVADVDYDLGKFVIYGDESGNAPTTFSDNDYFVPADPGGLDIPAMTNVPGIPDILDDDNTFQGINRALPTNRWARAYCEDKSSAYFDYDVLAKFFRKLHNPKEAVAHIETIASYDRHYFGQRIRYTPMETFKEDYTRLRIESTWLYADEDVNRDRVLVVDFDNVSIRTSGGIGPLHPAASGWRHVQGRPYLEYLLGCWLTTATEDVRQCGNLKIDNDNFAS